MRRYFYVYDFWNLFQMDCIINADSSKYVIVKYPYKDYPVFIISEDDTVSNYLASLENASEAVEHKLVELESNDSAIPPYYKEPNKVYDVTGNVNMLRPESI